MSKDDAFEEWLDRNWEILGGLLLCLGEKRMRTMFVKFNAHVIAALVARVGIELAGSALAYAIDGKAGMDSWVEYSNRVFALNSFIPDPTALIDPFNPGEGIIPESADMIMDHYGIPDPGYWIPIGMKTTVSSLWNLTTSRKRQYRLLRNYYES